MRTIKRGEIWLAALDPIIGRELAKTRPVVVISNDVANRRSGTSTVVPVTSQRLENIWPYEVFLALGAGGLPKDSKAKADQIRSLDQSRFIRRLGQLPPDVVELIERAVRIHLGMD
jgi:mRNA interferase MazF